METRWLQQAADRTGHPHGIVAECHLAEPDAVGALERHAEYRNLRGVRDFREGDYMADPAWQRGFRALGKFNLVGCVNTRLQWLPLAASLASSTPETIMCVDHCAIPESRERPYFERWRRGMFELAAVENVVIKISGLGMYDRTWTIGSLRPWVLTSIEAFGTKRTVFGSNWPVDRMFSSYPDLIDAYAEIIADFTEDEQRDMFARNAERIFRV